MRAIVDGPLRPTAAEMAADWARIPAEEQQATLTWLDLIEESVAADGPVESRVREIAARIGTSVGTARRMWDYALRGREVDGRLVTGWRAVVDWRKCRSAVAPEAPDLCRQWWVGLYERYKGRRLCARRAWNEAVGAWRLRQHPIPGYEAEGGFPPACRTGLPAGWSYAAFLRALPDQHERMVNQRGLAAAAPLRSLVYRSRAGLHCGEVYLFDDVWYDFLVKVSPASAPSRMLELRCMDLFSASRVLYGIKAELTDDDGTRQRLRECDMRFLVAAVFTLRGYWPQGCTVIGEHGTAHVNEAVRRVLYDASERVIQFADSGIVDRPAVLGWYGGEHRGNFRIKAALEGSFGLDHNARAMLPGQIGSNQQLNAPEEVHGRKAVDKALVKRLERADLPPELRAMIHWPFWPYSRAAELMHWIHQWIDGRQDHDLEGWEKAGLISAEFRIEPDSPHWYPAELLEDLPAEQRAAVTALISRPECFRPRKMSPAEVYARGQRHLVKLPLSIVPQILGPDLAKPLRLQDNGEFSVRDLQIDPDPVRYLGLAESPHGDKILLKCGEIYDVFVNPFDPRYLLVMAAGCKRYIGKCSRILAVNPTDTQALHEAMGRSSQALVARLRGYRSRHQTEVEQKAADEAHNAALLAGVTVRAGETPAAATRREERAGAKLEALADAAIDGRYGPREDANTGAHRMAPAAGASTVPPLVGNSSSDSTQKGNDR